MSDAPIAAATTTRIIDMARDLSETPVEIKPNGDHRK
jgi:hypothetical protein